MNAAQPVLLLWDASHIWGLTAWRALRALGLPCRLVKGQEIAQGALIRKPTAHGPAWPAFEAGPATTCATLEPRTPLLLVPGGNAKLKAAALGAAGRKAVRQYLAAGGNYLGFCGGAGLALSHADPDEGLNICPWARAAYPERLHHLISGHVRALLPTGGQAAGLADEPADGPAERSLPVWWPGRFAPDPAHTEVTVLASYAAPDADFWIADLPLRRIAPHIFTAWQDLYGVNLSADFLTGQPLAVSGRYTGSMPATADISKTGGGRYILSYSHLETPDSPAANAWLAKLLHDAFGLAPTTTIVPAWDLRTPPIALAPTHRTAPPTGASLPDAALTGAHSNAHSNAPVADAPLASALVDALHKMRALLDLAVEHNLFFERTPWLYGWRAGLPGAACNNLHAALHTAVSLTPSPAALAYRQKIRPRFKELINLFYAGAEGYLLACRLAQTLSPFLPDAVDARGLNNQRDMLFGKAMSGGGIVEELLTMTEEIIYLSQEADQHG